MAAHQYCTFRLQDFLFGVDVTHVQEVLRYHAMTPVPLAPASVLGLLNLRGHIVVAVDLRRRLGMPDRSAGQLPMNVVVHTNDGPVSLLVDDIGDVVEIAEDCFERPPETMDSAGRDLIVGTYKLPHCLLSVLDPDRAVDLSNEPMGLHRLRETPSPVLNATAECGLSA